MDTLTYPVFADESAEFTALQTPPSPIDLTDWELTTALATSLGGNANFQVTSPISDTGYFELQFHMGQNWWGCQFNYGNAPCGTHIRQAFAHAVDKNAFITQELQGAGVPIDNPVPPSVDLNTPDPCAWDSLHIQTGSGCQVNGVAGTAYHLNAGFTNNCATAPAFTYIAGCGSPDFCAAADHLIAANLATGKDATTCVLTGVAAAVTANPSHIFVRSDNTPRLHVGDGYAQFICALFTGAFTTGCGLGGSTTNVFVADNGPITSFPGFTTSNTTVSLTWWAYTAGFGNSGTFESSLFLGYDSQFVSGVPSIVSPTGPCDTKAVPSFAPGNYMYICNPAYDSQISQADAAPCLSAPGDPTTGQTNSTTNTVTFANCSGTSVPTAASSAYKAQYIYGKNALTIPWYSAKKQYAYLSGWQGVVLHKGNGLTPPGNFFPTLNAWQASPPVAGTLRQGFKQGTGTGAANPFVGNTVWDAAIQGSVYDSPGATNPDSPQAYLDWMTIKTDQLPASSLSYTPPAGTVAAFRYTLRNDINWQSGQKVTAWDLAFTDIAGRSSGAVTFSGLAAVTGVKVLSPTQVDLDVKSVGPFTKLNLASAVLPARDWLNPAGTCTATTWDNAANNPNFNAANTALTACILSAGSVTASGVLLPAAGNSNIDPNKIATAYDPVVGHNLIGSGPFQCGSGAGLGGPSCSSTSTQAVPQGQAWTLTRYGTGTVPGGSLNTYFRSSGNLALWAYSGDKGDFNKDFLNFGAVSLCFGKPVGTAGCTTWQHGIGGSAAGTSVGLTQVGIVQRFVGVNWVQPYDWSTSPPQNVATFPPLLHEGAVTLTPCSSDPVNGYDC
jgi:hypothetical protein